MSAGAAPGRIGAGRTGRAAAALPPRTCSPGADRRLAAPVRTVPAPPRHGRPSGRTRSPHDVPTPRRGRSGPVHRRAALAGLAGADRPRAAREVVGRGGHRRRARTRVPPADAGLRLDPVHGRRVPSARTVRLHLQRRVDPAVVAGRRRRWNPGCCWSTRGSTSTTSVSMARWTVWVPAGATMSFHGSRRCSAGGPRPCCR